MSFGNEQWIAPKAKAKTSDKIRNHKDITKKHVDNTSREAEAESRVIRPRSSEVVP